MLKEIKRKISEKRYEFSKHALDQSILRSIRVSEIEEAILHKSEWIEDYPNDKYGASCLIFGITQTKRPLHIVCSDPTRDLVKIITVYEPDERFWKNHKERIQE